jgi:acyl-CoA synthetase (AMP-forming)/AMP-acid ligase II
MKEPFRTVPPEGSEENANVARFLVSMAMAQPDHCAVRAPEKRRHAAAPLRYRSETFAELEASSNAVARALVAGGLQRGQRTLLMVKPGLDLIQICFALFKVGAIPVVIDPGMGLKNFLSCVRRTEPEALVGIPLATILSRLFRKDFRSLKRRFTVGRKGAPKDPGEFAAVASRVDELAAILFTSGSTGAPKGVCYEHGMFDAQVRLIRDTYGIQPGEVDLPMLPIFALFNPALGMTTIVPEMNPSRPATVEPERIVQSIEANGVTNSFGSPVLWTRIVEHLEARNLTLPTLRRILMAGAPASPALLRRLSSRLPHGSIHTPYGATECLPVSTLSAAEILQDTAARSEKGAGTCVGTPLGEVSARIIAPVEGPIARLEEATVLAPGEIGEIVVTGPSVTKAYDRLEDATRAAKLRDGEGRVWHRMGDLGYFDALGRLWFCGRKVESVQTARGPLYTDQVEGVFNGHPSVFRSALIGLGSAPHQTPAVVIEWKRSEVPLTPAELRQFALSNPLTKTIETFFSHPGFPVDVRHNAKIHRLTLKRQFDGGP